MSDYPPLHINRTFNASRQAVWDAWTPPEQFKQWYMPAPYSVPNCDFDVRVGGQLHIDTQDPSGAITPIVDEPSKLVLTNSPLDSDDNKLFEVQHTLVLSQVGEQTLLEITSEVLFAGPQADQFLQGMEPGLEQALNQLVAILISKI